jgi:hypothetical protein
MRGQGGKLRGGIKAWSEDLAWHPEVGGRAARGGQRRWGEAATVGRHGERDGADKRAPHGSDMRERRRLYRSAQSQREYTFRQIRQCSLGRAGIQQPAGHSGPAQAGLGRMGRNLKKIPFWIKIKFLNIPRLWEFAQGDLGGILTWGFFLNLEKWNMPCHVMQP